MGIEPTNGGTTIHCRNHLATPAISYLNIAFTPKIDPDIWVTDVQNVPIEPNPQAVASLRCAGYKPRNPTCFRLMNLAKE